MIHRFIGPYSFPCTFPSCLLYVLHIRRALGVHRYTQEMTYNRNKIQLLILVVIQLNISFHEETRQFFYSESKGKTVEGKF